MGNNGDYYLNNASGDIFRKESGTWVKIGNLKGPPFTPSTSKIRVYNSSVAQTLTGTSIVQIKFSATEFDILNEFSINPTSSRFIASQSGYYLITVNVGSSQSAVATLNLYIYKNGIVHSSTYVNEAYPHATITDIIYLNTNDYIELFGASGASKNNPLILGQDKLWMSIFRIV